MIRLLAILAMATAVAGCHITPRAANELAHREPGFLAAPPGHPFAAVEVGHAPPEVRTILGPPTSLWRYPTLWTFVPFYFGSDERRTVWRYQSQGRILFVDHPRTGELEVLRIEYDPREDGI
jgi:hypothetical protein